MPLRRPRRQRKAALDPRWIRFTAEDLARLDGTPAATGRGRWRLREAQRALGLTEEELHQRVRAGELIADRARAGEHREWRVSPADHEQPIPPPQPVGVHAEGQDVHQHGLTEAEIALVTRRALDQRLPDADALRRAVATRERPRSDARATVSWRSTVTAARRTLERLCPS